MSKSPLVSIILPTYNWRSEWLSESINSVLNQTFKDFELIIINDASTNNIEITILEYVKKDKRVIYLKNDKNLKIANTLNKWIWHSKWKYIARIDDDDIRDDKDKLKKQVNFMDNNPEYGVCWVSLMKCINEEWEVFNTVTYKSDYKDIRDTMLQTCPLAHPSVLIRKSVFNKCWLYNPSRITEDYDLWCRIGRFYKICNIDSYIKYRIHENSLSTSKNRIPIIKKASFKVFWKYKKYYPNFFRALICRIMDFTLPENFIKILLKIKNFTRWKF